MARPSLPAVRFVVVAVLAGALLAPAARADLISAAQAGDVAAVRAALDAGENPNVLLREENMGPLHFAVELRHEAVVALLLERGARVDAGEPVLPFAVGGDAEPNLKIVEMLLRAKAPLEAAGPEGWRPLHHAARAGHVAAMKVLLDAGARIEAATQRGETPLLMAATYQKPGAVNLLLERGAKVDARDAGGATALHSAAFWNFREIAQALLDKGAPQDLHTAAGTGDVAALGRLLEGGAAVDAPAKGWAWEGTTALMWAAGADRVEAVALLLSKGANPAAASAAKTTALHLASLRGQVAAARRLLEGGAPVDPRDRSGRTPLHAAAETGRTEVVAALLGAGADPSAVATSPRYAPLHLAALHGHVEVVNLLLAKGASPAPKTESQGTPLHFASHYPEVVRALLAKGAPAGAADNLGATPLHLAAQGAEAESVRLLLDAGADPKAKDRLGSTPLHRACAKDLLDVMFGGEGAADRPPTPEEQEREGRRVAVAEALLAKGADPKAKNERGRTALDDARESRYARVVALLEPLTK